MKGERAGANLRTDSRRGTGEIVRAWSNSSARAAGSGRKYAGESGISLTAR